MKFSKALLGLVALGASYAHGQNSTGFEWGGDSTTAADDATAVEAFFDAESNLQKEESVKTLLYNQWKADAEAFVNSNPTATFKLYKNIKADLTILNTFAKPDACTPLENDVAFSRVQQVLSGIFGSQDFDFNTMLSQAEAHYDENGYRNLRGNGSRELYSLCNSPYYRQAYGGCRRRRDLQEPTAGPPEEIQIEDMSPEGLEALVMKMKQDGESQCEGLLSLIAYTATDVQHNCRVTWKAAKCQLDFNIRDAIKLSVDGAEQSAEEMIAERQAANASTR